MEEVVDWVGRKVWIETFSGKNFQGKVIFETETKLILIDKFGFRIQLSWIDIKTCKEEF